MALSDEAAAYLRRFDPRLLATSEGRRLLTRYEPRLFALVYLRHHLAGPETDGVVSFSEAHLDWYERMLQWVRPTTQPKQWRHAEVAPRASAKTTTWFLIAPMWAAAHGHIKFCAAFADSASQAEGHLTTFKHELDRNELLRRDFIDLCVPAVRHRGATVSDNRTLMIQRSGFVFAARGVDSASLGLKVGERRPDLLVLDDVEPAEANYSAYLASKRLSTLQNAILPLNEWAKVVIVGTVTMNGSLIHQLVKTKTTSEDVPQWVADERIVPHYYPALVVGADGEERSLWPEKWSLDFLRSIRHTRSFLLNYQNAPVAEDGVMWGTGDIVTVEDADVSGCRHILSVDPAVTSKTSSDATGVALLSHDRVNAKVYVRGAWQFRLDPKALRTKLLGILEAHPEVRVILVETNQGGDLWRDLLGDLGVPVATKQQTVKKEVRAGWLLNGYQRREVLHTAPLPNLVGELLAFPRGIHDDLVDAVGTGYCWLTGIGTEAPVRSRIRERSYV